MLKTFIAKVEEQRKTQRQDFNLLITERFWDFMIIRSHFFPKPCKHYFKEFIISHPWNFWEMFFKNKSATASVWMKVFTSSAWSSGIVAFTFDSRNLQIRLPCPSVLLLKCAPHIGDLTRPGVVLSPEYLLPSVWVHPVFLV